MDFALSEEQKLIVETVRRFVRQELAPLEAQVEAEGRLAPELARAIHAKARAQGLFAMNVPAEWGGGGLSAVDTMLVEEQFGHTTDILIRRAFGNVYEALFACRGAQVERWLLPCVRGERVCSIAITEPGAGSDAAGILTRAVPTPGGGWRLSGQKHFISDGEVSDFFIVSALTNPPDAAKKEISLFLVDKGLPGFELGKDQPMMGLRGTSHLELFFDGIELDGDCLLGPRGEGFRMAMEVLGRVRLAQVGARAVGKAAHVLELASDQARQRRQFGQPIGDFQMVQQMIADSATEIFATRMMVLNTAWELDQGREPRDKVSMVKLYASEMIGRVADRGIQVFGGMGFCKDLPLERIYRDSRVTRLYDGTSEIHRMLIAKAVIKNGLVL